MGNRAGSGNAAHCSGLDDRPYQRENRGCRRESLSASRTIDAGSIMPANSIFESFLAGQGYALFEYVADGDFRLLGEWPDWCATIWGVQPNRDQLIGLADKSPFLENFLV